MILNLKVLKKFKDIAIKQKLLICLIVFMIMPLIITDFFINSKFENIIIHNFSENNLRILKQISQNLDTTINDTEDLSLKIISNDDIQNILKINIGNSEKFNRTYINIFSWLNETISSKTYFNSICLSKNNIILFQKSSALYNEVPEFVDRAMKLKGDGFWVGAYKLKTISQEDSTQFAISFYRAVNDFNMLGKTLGVESISINEDAICNSYKEVNPYKDGRIFLVDSSGTVLSSPDKIIIGKQYGNFDYVKKALEKGEGFFFTNIEHENNVVLVYTFKKTNWHLIEIIPEKSMIPLKTTINIVIIIAIALCILFGMLFSLVQNNFIIRPLYLLLNEMKKLRKGDFKVVLNTEVKDEIGEINRGFIEMAEQLEKTINDIYVGKIKQREAELSALESQINPHFLYNTLDSIHWLALKNKDYDVSEQIEALSELFKHVLSKGKETVKISDEFEFLECYMLIQKAKYGKRVNLVVDADEKIMNFKTPKLILQPLVENAILHGLEKKLEGGSIWVSVKKTGGFITYSISDDGIGTNEFKINEMIESIEESHNVFALKNIDERIKLKYGDEYGLKFYSKDGQGTRVEVKIPVIE